MPSVTQFLKGVNDADIGVSLDIENYCTASLFFEQASPIAMRCTSALYGVFRGFCLIG